MNERKERIILLGFPMEEVSGAFDRLRQAAQYPYGMFAIESVGSYFVEPRATDRLIVHVAAEEGYRSRAGFYTRLAPVSLWLPADQEPGLPFDWEAFDFLLRVRPSGSHRPQAHTCAVRPNWRQRVDDLCSSVIGQIYPSEDEQARLVDVGEEPTGIARAVSRLFFADQPWDSVCWACHLAAQRVLLNRLSIWRAVWCYPPRLLENWEFCASYAAHLAACPYCESFTYEKPPHTASVSRRPWWMMPGDSCFALGVP